MIEVYKVVRRVYIENGALRYSQLRSAIVTGRFEIAYIPGEWAVPAIGYILAFDIPLRAEYFMMQLRDRNNLELWLGTAEIDPAHQRTYSLLDSAMIQQETLMRGFWDSRHEDDADVRNHKVMAPFGTVLCARLNLSTRVNLEVVRP